MLRNRRLLGNHARYVPRQADRSPSCLFRACRAVLYEGEDLCISGLPSPMRAELRTHRTTCAGEESAGGGFGTARSRSSSICFGELHYGGGAVGVQEGLQDVLELLVA